VLKIVTPRGRRREARPQRERIDRSKPVSFSFAGWKVDGFEGDTLGSAAFAAGKRVFSRSFKYHRPRGLLCCSGHCPNCMMTVDGVPNVRVCTEPIRDGAVVEGQNVRWSLDFDLMSVTDKVGGPFTPVGFYYRTFIRPRKLWPFYEKFLRSAAGSGSSTARRAFAPLRQGAPQTRAPRVVGGRPGAAAAARCRGLKTRRRARRRGRAAARLAARRRRVLASGRALGIWERARPGRRGTVLYRFRAERIVVATEPPSSRSSSRERHLGVMLPDAVRRRGSRLSIKPGERAIVLGADDEDSRSWTTWARGSRCRSERSTSAANDPRELAPGLRGACDDSSTTSSIDCDLLVASGRQPAYSLLAQAGAQVEFDTELGVFVPTELPAGVEAVGSVTGEGRRRSRPSRPTRRARTSASSAFART
jgi:sarcosine oxidase subunit alpha